jgi:DNA-binding MarR family transcriptional regulator
MSTKFTTDALCDNPALSVGLVLFALQQRLSKDIATLVMERGHKGITAAHILFLSNLECGNTHASAVARRMGISRQAVYRSTRELQSFGVLELLDDPERRNQKIIAMTDKGKALVLEAQDCLGIVEARLGSGLDYADRLRLQSLLVAAFDSYERSVSRVDEVPISGS